MNVITRLWIIICVLVIVIFVLLITILSLILWFRKKDLDDKIARGRRTVERMERQMQPREYIDRYGNRSSAWADALLEIEKGKYNND